MNRLYWCGIGTIILFLIFFMSVLVACEKDVDDQEDKGAQWTPPVSNNNDDDDDNDDNDDDDILGSSPVISDASWSPDQVTYDPKKDYWISVTTFYVYDADNDLSGGNIYFLFAGTNTSYWEIDCLPWNDYTGLENVTDIYNPAPVSIGTIFSTGPNPPGGDNMQSCIDIEVSDGMNNFSNKLENICVTVP